MFNELYARVGNKKFIIKYTVKGLKQLFSRKKLLKLEHITKSSENLQQMVLKQSTQETVKYQISQSIIAFPHGLELWYGHINGT